MDLGIHLKALGLLTAGLDCSVGVDHEVSVEVIFVLVLLVNCESAVQTPQTQEEQAPIKPAGRLLQADRGTGSFSFETEGVEVKLGYMGNYGCIGAI